MTTVILLTVWGSLGDGSYIGTRFRRPAPRWVSPEKVVEEAVAHTGISPGDNRPIFSLHSSQLAEPVKRLLMINTFKA